MNSNNFVGQLIAGVAVVILIIPWTLKSIQRRHVDINGIVLDGIETVMETITRSDWNLGDDSRQDYPNPGGQ